MKKQTKVIVNIRLNPLVDQFYKKLAHEKVMNKSELIRKILNDYKENYEKINN